MSQVINTNIMSLNAQRNLAGTSTELATSLQRLSSGLRINSAKDDAAGLAITERFTTQIRGLNQAVRNSNDGISLAQTGEGALAEMTNNLQRIRELAVQSANATNSDSDRVALDQEVQQRLAEIDRIARQTSFNGRKILDGSFGNALFQVGANVGETINIELETSMRQASIGSIAVAETVDLSTLMDEFAGTPASYTTDAVGISDYSTVIIPATYDIGAFAVGADGTGIVAATDDQTLTFTAGTDTFDVVAVPAADDTAITAADFAAGFVAAGFAADGTGTVAGFTLDLGAEANITDAITNGSLTVQRADGVNFDVVLNNNLTAGDPSTFAGLTDATPVTTVDGDPADTSANASLTINIPGVDDDFVVTVDRDITSASDLAAAIQETADYATAGFTVAVNPDDNTQLVFTAADPGAGEFAFTDADNVLGLGAGTSVAGEDPESRTFDLTGLTFQVGDSANIMEVEPGTYSTIDDFLNSVNVALGSNASASYDEDTRIMTIISGETVTIGGDDALSFYQADPNNEFVAEVDGQIVFSPDDNGLSNVNVLTVDGSNDSIHRVDAALTTVSNLRSTFGAIQNRFESTIANLSATVENLSASRSRILDADFAAETAALTRAQILQQAGTAMLAQANQMPQSVLQLLQ